MNATINAFPPLHAFNSSRSWFMALIALLHLGFFWVLTHGLSIADILLVKPPPPVVYIPDAAKKPPEELPVPPQLQDVKFKDEFIPASERPELRWDDSQNAPEHFTHEPPLIADLPEATGSGPVITAPQVDPRRGLTEPLYPVAEIRQQHAGTVLLVIEVLENGRVGEVRIEQSSGYPRLDESAVREARTWRFIPGTRDGVPAAMWKQIPITFQLRD